MAAMLVGNTKSVFLRWGLKSVFINMISAKRLYCDHQPDLVTRFQSKKRRKKRYSASVTSERFLRRVASEILWNKRSCLMHKKKSSTLTGLTWCTNKAVTVYFLGVVVFAFFWYSTASDL